MIHPTSEEQARQDLQQARKTIERLERAHEVLNKIVAEISASEEKQIEYKWAENKRRIAAEKERDEARANAHTCAACKEPLQICSACAEMES